MDGSRPGITKEEVYAMKVHNHHRSGPTHPRARLSSDQVVSMRELYERGGMSYGVLAAIYGCGQSTARDIALYRTRRNG